MDTAAKAETSPESVVLTSALTTLEGRIDTLAETFDKHASQLEPVMAPSSPTAQLDSTSTVETSAVVNRLNEAIMRLDGIIGYMRRVDERLRV